MVISALRSRRGASFAIVRTFCLVGRETDVYFRLRPFLPDPGDEFLLELAVAGPADNRGIRP